MPTPFMHLNMAYKMIDRPEISPALAGCIKSNWPAFCLGNIAPDFQIICDVKRGRTHLYSTPPDPGDHDAFNRLLNKYPTLAHSERLTPQHALFLAGYGAHLLYDLVWFHNIVTIFTQGDWGDQIGRYIAHSSLLAYEDQQSFNQLPCDLGELITSVEPAGWLPLDPENYLAVWQKTVADQLFPNAEVQTVKIFASRMKLTTAELHARLADKQWLQAEIFDHAPPELMGQVLETSITMAIEQTQRYLAPIL